MTEHITKPNNDDKESGVISVINIQNQTKDFYANFYGSVVNNYNNAISTASNNSWKILYADNQNIYLVADDYITYEQLPSKTKNSTNYNFCDTGREYKVKFYNYSSNDIYNAYSNGLNEIVDTQYATANAIKMLNKSLLIDRTPSSPNQSNSQAVSCMLDTDLWKKFMDKTDGTGYAEYAIGGPTLEMVINSYNQSHGTDYTCEVETKAWGENYVIPVDENSNSVKLSNDVNQVYYIKSNISQNGWWLASPVNESTSLGIVYHNDGSLGGYDYSSGAGFRPVVCLKSDVELEKVGDYEYKIK